MVTRFVFMHHKRSISNVPYNLVGCKLLASFFFLVFCWHIGYKSTVCLIDPPYVSMTSRSHQIKVQTDPGRSAAAPSSRASGICHRPVTAPYGLMTITVGINVWNCMYLCMYACMHVCMKLNIYIYIYYIYICMKLYVCTKLYETVWNCMKLMKLYETVWNCMYVCLSVCMYACMHVNIYIYIYTHVPYLCICIYTYVFDQLSSIDYGTCGSHMATK